jgi:hypothetical protein
VWVVFITPPNPPQQFLSKPVRERAGMSKRTIFFNCPAICRDSFIGKLSYLLSLLVPKQSNYCKLAFIRSRVRAVHLQAAQIVEHIPALLHRQRESEGKR